MRRTRDAIARRLLASNQGNREEAWQPEAGLGGLPLRQLLKNKYMYIVGLEYRVCCRQEAAHLVLVRMRV